MRYWIKKIVLCSVMLLAASLCCHAGTGLVQEQGRTSQVTLYDNYFNSCRCFLVWGVDSVGDNSCVLGLVLEEGNADVPAGAQLSIVQRGGNSITLTRADRTRRGDITHRRFSNADIRYITVYYHITWEQLQQLVEEDCRQIVLKTTGGELKRNLKDVKQKIIAIYKQLKTKA